MMTDEELSKYGMKRVGNTFTQTAGNPRLAAPTPRTAVGPSLRPNWVPGGAPPMPAPGSIPVGQATEIFNQPKTPAPGSIPVGEATERFAHPGADPRVAADTRQRTATSKALYESTKGVRGPVVYEGQRPSFAGPGKSAPMERARMFNPAAPLEGVAAQGTRLQRAVAAGTRAARSATGVLPAAAGVGLNQLADRAFAPTPGTDGPGPATGTAVDQIPGGADPLHPTPPPQDPSFFRDTEIGRNIGNIINAAPGGRIVSGTLRAGSGAATAADVAGAAFRAAQSDNAMREPEPLPQSFPVGWGQGGHAAPVPETLTDVQRGGASAEVSGTPGKRPAAGEPPPPMDTTQGNLRAAEIMNDNYAAGLRLGAYGPGNHNADGTGGVLGGGMAWNEHNANYDRDMMRADVDRAIRLGGRRGPEQAAAIAAAYQASQRPEDRQSAENIAGMRERGDMNRADLAAGISRANNRDAVAASMRGQDLGLAETNMKNQFELGKLGVEQWNKDRQYRLDVQKTDAEQAKALQEQRSAREGALQRNIEAANVGPDGKPDMAAAAEYRRGIDRSVARMGADGVHQLSPLDEQRLLAGSDLLKVMRANANWLPWNPDKLKTIDPLDLTNLRVLPNGDRQITRPGKAAGQIIDRRFFQTEEGARFFGGTPTNKYDILSEGGK